MNRRDFVRRSTMAGFAAVLAGSVLGPSHVEGSELGFRGTDDGRIMRWDIAGETWREVVNFGPEYQVVELRREGASLSCRVAVGQHRFQLYSSDGVSWATSPRRRARAGSSRRALLSPWRVLSASSSTL